MVICKIYIQEYTDIGKGVIFSPKGKIIVGCQTLGSNSLVHHNVTFGARVGHSVKRQTPIIEEKVWVGPNSLIFGEITVGKGSTILEGTVLSKSVPARSVVGGNPGRLIAKSFDNAMLFNTNRYDYSISFFKEFS